MIALKWPLDKIKITQYFGENPSIYRQFSLPGHNGIDLKTRYVDTPLGHRYCLAAAPGWCEVRVNTGSGYGNHVRIHHADGSMTIYGHLWRVYVFNKQVVKTGDRLGLTDSSGFSTGPHLHLELRMPGWERKTAREYFGAVDPLPYLPPVPKV